MRDDRHAQPHRIDVPGGDVQPHAKAPVMSRLSSWGEARRKPADMVIPAICRNVIPAKAGIQGQRYQALSSRSRKAGKFTQPAYTGQRARRE
jgi:hypothetical protein